MASARKAPLVICGVNINAITEPAQLHQLLQQCQDFDDKNKIFARLMDIMPGGPGPAPAGPLGPPRPAQYTCSIVTQETQTAELPPPVSTSMPGVHHAPRSAPPDHQTPEVTSVNGGQLPWTHDGRAAGPHSPASSGGSRPPWARDGRTAAHRSLDESSVSASQLPWARQARPSARASSVSRIASTFSRETPPPPPPVLARLEKTRSLYSPPSDEGDDVASRAAPTPHRQPPVQHQRKMSFPQGSRGFRPLERSKSEEQLGRRLQHMQPSIQRQKQKLETVAPPSLAQIKTPLQQIHPQQLIYNPVVVNKSVQDLPNEQLDSRSQQNTYQQFTGAPHHQHQVISPLRPGQPLQSFPGLCHHQEKHHQQSSQYLSQPLHRQALDKSYQQQPPCPPAVQHQHLQQHHHLSSPHQHQEQQSSFVHHQHQQQQHQQPSSDPYVQHQLPATAAPGPADRGPSRPTEAGGQAAAEAVRLPWTQPEGRAAGRVKLRAAALSAAEPPPPPPAGDRAAPGRPVSGEFGRDAFGRPAASQPRPLPLGRPADGRLDLRTAPLARASRPAEPEPAPARLPPQYPRPGAPRAPPAAEPAGRRGLQRSSSSDLLRFGAATKPFEAHLDAASAEQKKQRLMNFFREREDERLARSFDDLLDDLDEEAVAAPPAGKSVAARPAPHALTKSHTVGELHPGRRARPDAAFASRQRAWENSIGTSMSVGLGSSTSHGTRSSTSASRRSKIDEDTLDLVRKYFAKEGM